MKKVLFITYYFPPCGGISIIRPLKLIKYLRSVGWEPVLVTPKDAHYPTIDKGLINDFPQDIERIEVPIWEPYSLYKKFTARPKDENVMNALVVKDEKSKRWKDRLSVFIRSNFFIPDARKFWVKKAVNQLSEYLENNHVDAIFTEGPPHSVTLIGARLKEKFNIPWLSDYQDPWTQIDYYKELILTPWADQYHHKLEKFCFDQADATVIVSKAWKKDLEDIGAHNVHTIPWGFDPNDFSEIENIDANNSKFIMTHLGLAGHDRVPNELMEAVVELAKESEEFKEKFQLQFIGQIDKEILDCFEENKPLGVFKHIPQLSRNEALKHGKESSVLLLLLNKADNASGRIPGKLFEYLALDRNILLLGNKKGNSAEIVLETNMGTCFEYNEKEETKAFLRKAFDTWTKEKKLPLDRNEKYKNYTSKKLVGDFGKILDEITQ
ncbi:glycosyltransferase [Flammeovirga sp. EKP202]|uniref:glycosyltransferase n=1 Tax=Flammeovirga sp. EKP202 TaxID=2770592 RepID=UPI00165FB469|nr:glycosyltransferase [Flammeovirga sp. EKP202]MBD0405419.1 glycosyltransferase [Flammeovirga sp. EKP202]